MELMTKKQEEQLVKNHKASQANPDKDLGHKAVIKLFTSRFGYLVFFRIRS